MCKFLKGVVSKVSARENQVAGYARKETVRVPIGLTQPEIPEQLTPTRRPKLSTSTGTDLSST